MKKVLAFVLMLVLAFSASAVVFAADDEVAFIEKGWVNEEGDSLSDGEYPEIELEFEILAKSAKDNSCADYDTDSNIPDVTFGKSASSTDITVSGLDSIDGVGIFTYKIKEINPNVAGVTANTNEYTVEIMRSYKMENGKATDTIETSYAFVLPVSGSDAKPEEIENTYVDGDLTIDKTVTGNLSYKDDVFTVELEFTSSKPVATDIVLPDGSKVSFSQDGNNYKATAEIEISDSNGVMTVSGIPVGVEVKVTEKDPAPYELVGYSVNGGESSETAPTITMTANGASVEITNHYSTNIDTGISLDSLPYILIIAGVAAAAVFFVIRKRRSALDID